MSEYRQTHKQVDSAELIVAVVSKENFARRAIVGLALNCSIGAQLLTDATNLGLATAQRLGAGVD
jgi:hypothetical protein